MLRPWGTQPVSSLPTCRELWLRATTPPLQVFCPHRGRTCPVSQATQPAVPLLPRAAPEGASRALSRHVCLQSGSLGGPIRPILILRGSRARLEGSFATPLAFQRERERETAARQEQKPHAVSFPKRRALPASSLPLPATLFLPPPNPQLSVRSVLSLLLQ